MSDPPEKSLPSNTLAHYVRLDRTAYTVVPGTTEHLSAYTRQLGLIADRGTSELLLQPPDPTHTHFTVGQRLQLSSFSPPATVVQLFVGGFGEVYVLREDDITAPLHVVKTPRLALSHLSSVVTQFAYEATLWTHLPPLPNVLPAYDVRLHNRQPYLRMKYVPPHFRGGASLEALIAPDSNGNRGVGNVGMVAFIAGQLTGVLADLERTVPGFIHGDIKPANLLLDLDPQMTAELKDDTVRRLLLSDFGLAWSLAMREIGHPLTAGDVQYLAPEIFEGEAVSKGQDIYAVGCTLFELTFGLPFQILTKDGAILRLTVNLADFQHRRPDISSRLLELILSCLDADPERRPSSFGDLHSGYRAAVRDAGGHIRDVKPTMQAGHPHWLSSIDESPLVHYLTSQRNVAVDVAKQCAGMLTEANEYSNVGLFSKSEETVKAILEFIPEFPSALACRGYRLSLQARQQEALHWYMLAVRGYFEDPALQMADPVGYGSACGTAAQLIAGSTTTDENLLEVAAHCAIKAVETLPENAKAGLALGMALLRIRQFELAERILEASHRIDPSNKATQYYRGAVVLARDGCQSSTQITVRRGLKLDENTIEELCRFLKAVNLC